MDSGVPSSGLVTGPISFLRTADAFRQFHPRAAWLFLHAKRNIRHPNRSITNPHQRLTLIKRDRSYVARSVKSPKIVSRTPKTMKSRPRGKRRSMFITEIVRCQRKIRLRIKVNISTAMPTGTGRKNQRPPVSCAFSVSA